VSKARTLVVTRRKPVALLIEAHSTQRSLVHEQKESAEELLRMVSPGVPVKVIMLVPTVEAIFCQAPGVLAKACRQEIPSDLLMLARGLPREALAQLLAGAGGPRDMQQLLDSLDDQDVKALRNTEPIRELITFLEGVARPLPQASVP
jgi:hypothetical protein